MKSGFTHLIEPISKFTLVLTAAVSLISFIIVALIRMNYPFELEWIEEGVLVHVLRVANGLPIYTNPTLEFVPFIYPPLFYYISALATKIVGVGFMAMRIVSFLSSLGIASLVFMFVKKETKDLFTSFLASCFFISCYSAVIFWFDIGRVDSLTLLFFFSFLYLVRFYPTFPSYIVAGIFITLSFLTKQEGLPLSLPIIIYLFILDWKKASALTLSLIISLILSIIILDYVYNGLFSYYTIILPFEILNNSIQPSRLISIWTKDIIKQVPIIVMLFIYFIIFGKNAINKKMYSFYLITSLCIMLGSVPYRAIRYGNSNALMPVFIILSIVGGIAYFLVISRINESNLNVSAKLRTLLYLAIVVHFITLIYSPNDVLPSQAQKNLEEELIEEIGRHEGKVYIPSHGYIATLAGKETSSHLSGLDDLLSSDATKFRDAIYRDLMKAFEEQRFSAIILDQFWFTDGQQILKQLLTYYEVERDGNGIPITYRLYNQDLYRPTMIFVPKKQIPAQ